MTTTNSLVLPLALLVALATEVRSQAGTLDPLYRSGEEGYRCFRIPAIVATTRGTLLAFAEGRKNDCGENTCGNLAILFEAGEKGPYEGIFFRELRAGDFRR